MSKYEITVSDYLEAAPLLSEGSSIDCTLQLFELAGNRDIMDFVKGIREQAELAYVAALADKDSELAGLIRQTLRTLTDVIIDIIEGHAESQDE